MTDQTKNPVGYMSPPEHSRFKKGHSGNPKGRLKKPDDIYLHLKRVQKRQCKPKGVDRQMPISESLTPKLRELALSGDRRKLALQRIFSTKPASLRPGASIPKQRESRSSIGSGAWTRGSRTKEAAMSDQYDTGYGKPPKASRRKKGQSGTPKGRPKTRSDLVGEAAAILSETVAARTPEGRKLTLAAYEAGYLALKRGLKGHVQSAIKIMLDVQHALDARELNDRQRRQNMIARLERWA